MTRSMTSATLGVLSPYREMLWVVLASSSFIDLPHPFVEENLTHSL